MKTALIDKRQKDTKMKIMCDLRKDLRGKTSFLEIYLLHKNFFSLAAAKFEAGHKVLQ